MKLKGFKILEQSRDLGFEIKKIWDPRATQGFGILEESRDLGSWSNPGIWGFRLEGFRILDQSRDSGFEIKRI